MTDDADQISLFAPLVREMAHDLKVTGMERAATAQELLSPGWDEDAYQAILRVARRQPTVHVDDLVGEAPSPPHFNAWGSVWERAVKNHIIVKTGEWRPCLKDPQKHQREARVYKSNIYRP